MRDEMGDEGYGEEMASGEEEEEMEVFRWFERVNDTFKLRRVSVNNDAAYWE